MWGQIITVLFVFAFITQGVYIILFLWFRPTAKIITPPNSQPKDPLPVSIILCARNAEAYLINFLPHTLQQSYLGTEGQKLFEVIVVNDNSTDNSLTRLLALKENYPHLTVLSLAPGQQGKKQALAAAAAIAANEILLFTDADCYPLTADWARLMAECFTSKTHIVAGYGGYRNTGTLLHQMTGFETVHSFVLYSSLSRIGLPYMAVGRNMAVRKSVFMETIKAELYNTLPYGDDDLLVSQIAHKDNMCINYLPEAKTLSHPESGWVAWLKQKQRHVSTGKYYKGPVKLALGLYACSHALIYLLPIYFIFNGGGLLIFALWLLYVLFKSFVLRSYAKALNEKKLNYVFLDFSWMIYNFVVSPFVFFINKKKWR